eukprot:scaffold244763_cov30-Tisochrysis_lutea.AAC.2
MPTATPVALLCAVRVDTNGRRQYAICKAWRTLKCRWASTSCHKRRRARNALAEVVEELETIRPVRPLPAPAAHCKYLTCNVGDGMNLVRFRSHAIDAALHHVSDGAQQVKFTGATTQHGTQDLPHTPPRSGYGEQGDGRAKAAAPRALGAATRQRLIVLVRVKSAQCKERNERRRHTALAHRQEGRRGALFALLLLDAERAHDLGKELLAVGGTHIVVLVLQATA